MKLSRLLLLTFCIAGSASASTINFMIAADTGAATWEGVPLDSSYTVYIGTFNPVGFTFSNTFSDIQPRFNILSSVSFATGELEGANGYAGMSMVSYPDGTGFNGAQFYVWITDGDNRNALITGFGILPSNDSVPNFAGFSIESSNAASLTYLLGSYDPSSPNLAGSGGNVIIGVPEPSAILLGTLGVIGMLRRHRR